MYISEVFMHLVSIVCVFDEHIALVCNNLPLIQFYLSQAVPEDLQISCFTFLYSERVFFVFCFRISIRKEIFCYIFVGSFYGYSYLFGSVVTHLWLKINWLNQDNSEKITQFNRAPLPWLYLWLMSHLLRSYRPVKSH